jgi:hypothetical protein
MALDEASGTSEKMSITLFASPFCRLPRLAAAVMVALNGARRPLARQRGGSRIGHTTRRVNQPIAAETSETISAPAMAEPREETLNPGTSAAATAKAMPLTTR